jgi:hypothetical protein
MSKHPCWNIGASDTVLFGAVQTAIGEQFMCRECAKGADQPLTPDTFHGITAHDIVDTGLWFKCDRCGDAVDEDILMGVEPIYTLPQTDAARDTRNYEEAWVEEMLYQHLDHVAENKERERMDF